MFGPVGGLTHFEAVLVDQDADRRGVGPNGVGRRNGVDDLADLLGRVLELNVLGVHAVEEVVYSLEEL